MGQQVTLIHEKFSNRVQRAKSGKLERLVVESLGRP